MPASGSTSVTAGIFSALVCASAAWQPMAADEEDAPDAPAKTQTAQSYTVDDLRRGLRCMLVNAGRGAKVPAAHKVAALMKLPSIKNTVRASL